MNLKNPTPQFLGPVGLWTPGNPTSQAGRVDALTLGRRPCPQKQDRSGTIYFLYTIIIKIDLRVFVGHNWSVVSREVEHDLNRKVRK